jgi:hypothetical protein
MMRVSHARLAGPGLKVTSTTDMQVNQVSVAGDERERLEGFHVV